MSQQGCWPWRVWSGSSCFDSIRRGWFWAPLFWGCLSPLEEGWMRDSKRFDAKKTRVFLLRGHDTGNKTLSNGAVRRDSTYRAPETLIHEVLVLRCPVEATRKDADRSGMLPCRDRRSTGVSDS